MNNKIIRIREVVDYSDKYIKNFDKSRLKQVNPNAQLELDEYNQKIAETILLKMLAVANQLYDNIVVKLNAMFLQFVKDQRDPGYSQTQKAEKLIDFSIRLAIFERDDFDDNIDKILSLRLLLLDN